MIKYLTLFFVSFSETVMGAMLVSRFGEKRVSSRLYYFCLAATTVTTFILSSVLHGTAYLFISYFLIYCTCFSIIYTAKPKIAIIVATVVSSMIQACSEMIVTFLISLLFSNAPLDFLQNDYTFSIGAMISKFVAFIIVFLVSKKQRILNLGLSKPLAALLLIQPAATIFVTLMILRLGYIMSDIPNITFLLMAVLLIGANLSVIFLIYRQKDYIETKTRLSFAYEHIENQLSHYEELYRYQNELRIFRHDIKNRLLSVSGLLRSGQVQNAIDAINGELCFLDESSYGIINSGNPAVDAILQSKLLSAKKRGVSMEISSKITDEIKIDMLEFGVLLGNALDNAIEAAEKCDSLRCISVKILTVGGRISIEIKNPVPKGADTASLSSTKPDKINHGFGIRSIKTIAEKYDGKVFFDCIDGTFVTGINIAN